MTSMNSSGNKTKAWVVSGLKGEGNSTESGGATAP